MNLPKKILLALGVIAATGVSFAQTSAASGATPVGVLGQKYADVSYGVQDIRHYSHNAYDLTLQGNTPVAPNVDLSAAYSYAWIHGPGAGHANTIGLATTAYAPMHGVKPFVTGAVGYQWVNSTTYEKDFLWAAAVGVEIPVGTFSLTPRITYQDDFRGTSRSDQQVTYELEGNVWLNRTSAVYGSVGKVEVLHSPVDAWAYRIGYRMKF